MQAGNYLLAKFSSRKELLPAAELLDKSDTVKRWNAVDGYYSLVIKTDGNDARLIASLKGLDGFAELAKCELVTDNDSDEYFTDELNHTFLFMEVDSSSKKTLISKLSECETVSFCSETEGAYDLVVFTSAENFDTIDRTVAEEIRQYDGILRMKQNRVIHLDRM